MDNLLASVGRILEGLPIAILAPMVMGAALFFAWWQSQREDCRRSAADKAGIEGKIDKVLEEVLHAHRAVADVHKDVSEALTEIKIIKDRGSRR